MFRIGTETHFDSAHLIKNYPGKCKNLHGHTYVVKVSMESDRLNSLNMVVDLSDIKKALKEYEEKVDHKFLNDVYGIEDCTCEWMARDIHKFLKSKFKGVRKLTVRVYEGIANWGEYE
jgi:6-pyruvoyltetrahydropterin/6-carboxytetrahydropterin synthase